MRLMNAQPGHMTTFWVVSRPGVGRWHASVIVKAGFRLVPGAVAVPDEEKPPVASGDDPSEPGAAPRYASDFVPHKAKADVLAVGAAHAPGGVPVPACRVSIGVGDYFKSLAVFGDRRWEWGALGASPGEPEPFVTMPLGWERAYGAPDSRANPVGRGGDVRSGAPLPNVEHIGQRIAQPTHRPAPAGFGPIATTWQPRFGKAGTYDDAWLATRWPWFPADFDWSFFNAAPPDQQFASLRGDEGLAFENMHPDHPVFRCRLPGVAARAFLRRAHDGEETHDEVPLRLDTVWADVAAEKLILVWRGMTRVRGPRLREIAAMYGVLEPLDAPEDAEIHLAALAKGMTSGPNGEQPGSATVDTDKAREDALARIAKLRGLTDGLGAAAEQLVKAAGGDPARLRSRALPDDPLAMLDAAIAALKASNPEKGQQLEDRLKDIDAKAGEAAPKTQRQMPWTRELVAAALAAGESLAKAKLDGLNLAALDFGGADLSDATLLGANLNDARLDQARLAGADLGKSVLTHASFAGADLSRANFAGAAVASASFADARVDAAVFVKLDLSGADFSGAAGEAADFTECVLDGASFVGARLPSAKFTSVRASAADFSAAVLRAADFAAARAPGIVMRGADLTNLRANRGADFTDGQFARIDAPRSIWQQATLDRANFDGAVLSQAQLPEVSLRDARIDRAHLEGANFDDAILAGARITNSNLLRASFTRADLTGCVIQGCNLYGAGLLDATLEGASFEGSMVVLTLLAR